MPPQAGKAPGADLSFGGEVDEIYHVLHPLVNSGRPGATMTPFGLLPASTVSAAALMLLDTLRLAANEHGEVDLVAMLGELTDEVECRVDGSALPRVRVRVRAKSPMYTYRAEEEPSHGEGIYLVGEVGVEEREREREREGEGNLPNYLLTQLSPVDNPVDNSSEGSADLTLFTPPTTPSTNQALSVGRRDVAASFKLFYDAYPRHEGRKYAERAWAHVSPEGRQAAIDVAKRMRAIVESGGGPESKNFILLPSTFLNQERWDDWAEGNVPAHWGPTHGSGEVPTGRPVVSGIVAAMYAARGMA